jgi:uncharacterized protein
VIHQNESLSEGKKERQSMKRLPRKKAPVPTKKLILSQIKKLEPELRKMKVKELYLFGSVARGDADLKSDIDVLVTFSTSVDLFDLSDLKQLLQRTLGRKVDIVMREAIRKEYKVQVEREMIRAA